MTELQSMVRGLLTSPRFINDQEWSLQGFGMLRCYIGDSDVCRLNVWDNRYVVEGYSPIHNHPWDFTSTIVSGSLIDQRYEVVPDPKRLARRPDGMSLIMKPGIAGMTLSEPVPTIIRNLQQRVFRTGDSYAMQSWEFHATRADTGTITINTRERVGDDVARVAWFGTGPFVSSKPRRAEPHEISDIIERALEGL